MPDTPHSGAYGFRVRGELLTSALLTPCPPSWPPLEVVLVDGGPPSESEDKLLLGFGEAGAASLEQGRQRVLFHTPGLSADELVHPYLAPVAGTFALWCGRQAFHGGAVAAGDRAWAILGDRRAGKSSLLGRLAVGGHPVVSDDLLVTNGTTAYAGPRCVDLRSEVAELLGVGRPLWAGQRERWRLELGPVSPELTLGGWLFLAWADRVETTPVPPSKRLAYLIKHHLGLPVPSPEPGALLKLAALPAWELRRPRALSSLDAAAQCLLDTVS